MAQIREELVLYDSFTNTFTKYIRQSEQAANVTDQTKQATQQFESSQRAAATATDGLTGSIKSLVGGYLSLQGIKGLFNLSDTITSTTARLDMMNDGLQTTAELNDTIWQSAQRSRGAYASTANLVAQLGNLAGEAFDSSQEVVAFAEQINKQIALSGASAAAADAALLQLTQGLSSGALRGEELNSILEQTPTIARTIADYMGVTTGEMRELASEGAVTAEVVKNAMLAAADETNAAFESMPMTWSQVWTSMQNVAQKALQPILNGVSWLANNLEIVGPIVIGVAVAFGLLAVAVLAYNAQQKIANTLSAISAARAALASGATLAQAAATTTATGAQVGLNAALLACPITWIVIGFVALVAALYAVVGAINQVTGSSISATGLITGAVATALAFVGNLFITLVNAVVDVFVVIYNVIAMVANFVANVFVDPLGAAARLFFDFADVVLSVLQGIASAIDTIFGSNLAGAVQGWRDSLSGWVDEKFGAGVEVIPEINAQDYHLDRFQYGDAFQAGYDWGKDLNLFGGGSEYDPSSILGEIPLYEEIAANTGDTAKSAASIEKSVNMADEDLKNLVDMAERQYVNQINLTAQTPVITINGANTGNTQADRKALGDAIRDIILEQAAAGSYRSTARAYTGG
jgi:tape measure domain-containing protein